MKAYDLDKDIPKQLKFPKQDDELYYLPFYRSVRVIKKAAKKPETPEDRERKERDKRKKEIKARIKEMDARRKEFIQNIISGKIETVKKDTKVHEEIWNALVDLEAFLSTSNMMCFFTGKSNYECVSEERKEALAKVSKLTVLHQMLVELNYGMEHAGDIYDWQVFYNENCGNKLIKAYGILEKYGWTFEGDEKQLLDGTHELYTKKKT